MSAVTETRIHTSLLAALEKRCLIWIAKRLPEGVNSDHLTGLGAVSMLGAGACYWLGAQYPAALVAAVVCLALNWFGDSLDGTLARVRRQERPRYGFYVDHVLDVVGIVAALRRTRCRRVHDADHRRRFPAGLLPAVDRDRARHSRRRDVQDRYWKMGPTEYGS